MGSDKENLARWADLVLDGKPINIDQTIRQQAARIAALEATITHLREVASEQHAWEEMAERCRLPLKPEAAEKCVGELREAVKVLAAASMGAEDAKWRMRECQKSIAGACGQTVQECFAAMRYHNVPSSIFDRYDEAMQAAMANPIAAAAVREAGR